MIKINFKKGNFLKYLALTVFSNLTIYFFQFFIFSKDVDYFLCTEIKTYDLELSSRSLTLIYPESCDLRVYSQGILNILSFYKIEDYVYFDRPLMIIYISIIYFTLKSIIGFFLTDPIVLIKLSFYIGQVILTSLICMILYRIFSDLNLKIGKKYLLFPWMVALSPIFKWHIFESTSMTFTFLIYLIGIFICLNDNKINLNFYFLISGIIFLIHRSALLIVVLFIFYKLFSKKLNLNNIKNLIIFFIPLLIHYSLMFLFADFSDHQAEGYRQFIWIIDYLQGRETLNGGYFCQTPKLAINCYKNDLVNLFNYLLVPSLVAFLFLISKFADFNKKIIELIKVSILFALIINVFWLFIGWYPPIRFSFYGYGNLIILFLIFLFIFIDKRIVSLFFILGYTSYFLLLNHWNFAGVIKYNFFIHLSIFLFLISFIFSIEKIEN